MSKPSPLTPAMQHLVNRLEQFGYIDRIAHCGRTANGGRIGTNTIVALMKRGIIREAKYRYGVHMPATTPEQVWDEAHAENDRRDAEQAAHLADNTNWVQTHPDGEIDAHTRQTRNGRTVLIEQASFRHWDVYFGDGLKFSAGGTWQEVRRAADRFERNEAHNYYIGVHETHCCKDHGCKYGDPHCPVMTGKVVQEFACEECMDEAETVERVKARVGTVQPGDTSTFTPSVAEWYRTPLTPAETGADTSARTATVLADVTDLRRQIHNVADRDTRRFMRAALDRIEKALRAAGQ